MYESLDYTPSRHRLVIDPATHVEDSDCAFPYLKIYLKGFSDEGCALDPTGEAFWTNLPHPLL